MATSKTNFLMRSWVIETILGSFLFLTLPLVFVFIKLGPDANWFNIAVNVFFVALGMSHFMVTFAVYCNRSNLKFFFSDVKKIFLYVVAPISIVALVICFHHFKLWNQSIVLGVFVLLLVRAADFLHVQRQSYGVMQLLKGSTGLKFPARSRSLENAFFVLMAVSGWIAFTRSLRDAPGKGMRSFTEGEFYAWLHSDWVLPSVLGTCAILFVIIFTRLLNSTAAGHDWKQKIAPGCYFTFQSGSILLAVIDTRLYIVGLAMHYTEYHLLMYQRSFHAEGSFFSSVGQSRWLRLLLMFGFYLVVLTVTLWLAYQPGLFSGHVAVDSMSHVFMGITVLHFYVEALIWRFRVPHFRENLLPVFFEN